MKQRYLWAVSSFLGLVSVAAALAQPSASLVGAAPVASGSVESSVGNAVGIRGTGRFYDQPPSLSPEMMLQIEIAQQWCRDNRGQIIERVDPNAPPPSFDPNAVETPAPRQTGAYETRAPGDFRVWRVTTPTPTVNAAGGSVSTTAEPSVANAQDLIFMTANWFAALSSDGGLSWRYISPYDNFPSDGTNDLPNNSGIFCCDQNVIYIPSRDLWCWQLQYRANANSNVQRTVFFSGRENMLNNNYCFYDWSPASVGYPVNGFWFDFPDISYGNDFLYLATNLFAIGAGSTSTCALIRIPLTPVTTCSGFGFNYYVDTTHPGFRLTHGATTVMYFGAHHTTNTMRIYNWPENSGSINFNDTGHTTYNTGAFSAVTNDGNNWAGNGDTRLLGAYRANGELGFMFHVPQTAGRPFPRTLIKRFNEATRALTGEQEVFNNSIAFMYPSVHPNSNNEWGGTIMYGAGGTYPTGAAWIADGFNGRSMQPMELAYLAGSNQSPGSNRYGDYYETARLWLNSRDWIGAVHTINSGVSNVYQAMFGREANTPLADVKVRSVDAVGGTYRQGQNINISFDIANVGISTSTADTLYFYASTGRNITGSFYFLGSTPLGALANGQVFASSRVGTFPVSIPPGLYYIAAYAVAGTEAFYTNNIADDPFRVNVVLANDSCSFPTPVGLGSYFGNNTAATLDGFSDCVGTTNRDVYYSFTPDCTAVYRIDTCGSTMDSVLSVLTNCPGVGTELACNDDNVNGAGGCAEVLSSALNVGLDAGSTYIIRVAGYSNDRFGPFRLNLSIIGAQNDVCANAISVGDGAYDFSNCAAFSEILSLNACRFGYLDVWYTYYPPCDGVATIDTCNVNYDTVLMAFDIGCPDNNTIPIECNDDIGGTCGPFGLGSTIVFPVAAGQPYTIRLAAYSDSSEYRGSGVINFSCVGTNPCGCAADYNQDGGVTGDDVDAFFSDWENASGCSDVNLDGGVTGDDVDAFFAVWSEGAC